MIEYTPCGGRSWATTFGRTPSISLSPSGGSRGPAFERPTNEIFANHNFIAAAVGIEPADVTPIDGSYYPPQAAAAAMTSRLELISL